MDKSQFEAKLLTNYCDLVSINREQLQLATMERYDSQIFEVQVLEKKKNECQIAIQTMLDDINGYSSLSESTRDQIENQISELQLLNQQLEQIINDWYAKDSSSMKQVRTHRTTLQAYGGANNADFVSYYIDNKK